jgi:AcrR family transcriptional regulator
MPYSLQKWIEAGYELFSVEGPDGVQVEKLARILGFNKSGFYHHFGDREGFFYQLIQHHYRINRQFCDEISFTNKFSPDFINLALKYRTAVLVQKQLRKYANIPMFKEAFDTTKKLNATFIIPLWAEYLKIPDNYALSEELYTIFQDVFFMDITHNNFTFKFVNGIATRFLVIISAVKRYGFKPNPYQQSGF